MGLNDTPSGDRVHIGFFGRRNAGKSSVVNAVTGQDLAIVSDVKGTTTDPVYKAMELLPLGPVMIIDTPGFDDEGALGELRVRKTRQVLNKTDVAVLVVDASVGKTAADEELIRLFEETLARCFILFRHGNHDITIIGILLPADNDLIAIENANVDHTLAANGQHEELIIVAFEFWGNWEVVGRFLNGQDGFSGCDRTQNGNSGLLFVDT